MAVIPVELAGRPYEVRIGAGLLAIPGWQAIDWGRDLALILGVGWLAQKHRMKMLLVLIYGARAVAIAVFLVARIASCLRAIVFLRDLSLLRSFS